MGVRDALRMVDSFNRWAQRNPGRAKSLDDFIHDGLIAAAKRCESCLREKLGLSFSRGEPDEDEFIHTDSTETAPTQMADVSPSSSEMQVDIPEEDFEVSVESKDIDFEEEVDVESEESAPSLDSVHRLEDEKMDDIILEGPQRDFSSDFQLVEPSPLIVESDDHESNIEKSPDESELSEIDDFDESHFEDEEEKKSPAFTWSDYEAAVAPSHDLEPPEVDLEEHDELSSEYEDEDSTENNDLSDNEDIPLEPPAPFSGWESIEEDIPPQDIAMEEIADTEDKTVEHQSETEEPEASEEVTDFTEPPSPPPPPESEEDEEERRRRARRLFFGA